MFEKQCRGVSLLEVMVTVAIISIIASLALPSFSSVTERNQVKGAAETLAATLRFAQAESIKRNRTITVNFATANSGAIWCYGLMETTTCDCTETDSTETDYCQIDGVHKVAQQSDNIGITAADFPASSINFTPIRGSARSDGATFTSTNGYQLRTVVSILGRVRLCVPIAATQSLPDFPSC